MNASDLKPGLRVVPHQKTVGFCQELEDSRVWKRAKERNQPFLYFKATRIIDSEIVYVLSDSPNAGVGGDFFDLCDFERYHPESIQQTNLF